MKCLFEDPLQHLIHFPNNRLRVVDDGCEKVDQIILGHIRQLHVIDGGEDLQRFSLALIAGASDLVECELSVKHHISVFIDGRTSRDFRIVQGARLCLRFEILQLSSDLSFRFAVDGLAMISFIKAEGELTGIALTILDVENGFVLVADRVLRF